MAASRETIMTALFALVSGINGLVTTGRRMRSPKDLDPTSTPALFLVEEADPYERPDNNLPPIRRMHASVVIYQDVGTDQTVVPATAVNNILDALDVVLKPDNPFTGKLTLGGIVDAVIIDGAIERGSGDMTGKSIAVVPITILLP